MNRRVVCEDGSLYALQANDKFNKEGTQCLTESAKIRWSTLRSYKGMAACCIKVTGHLFPVMATDPERDFATFMVMEQILLPFLSDL